MSTKKNLKESTENSYNKLISQSYYFSMKYNIK